MSSFTFNISLSVLNHLGRNLYRNFSTVLGEAISNAWDADATEVKINIDKENNKLTVIDNGLGMSASDFQDRFLKIGYSKRKDGTQKSTKNRPFIGRKGIGKLALLSCARRVIIVTKYKSNDITGGVIDNDGLTQAITEDLTPQEYQLSDLSTDLKNEFPRNFGTGTMIVFEQLNDGIKSSIQHLQKLLAMHFRFSLIDPDFKIELNGEVITIKHLQSLIDKTQFLWELNYKEDPILAAIKQSDAFLENKTIKLSNKKLTGFIASVQKPRDLAVYGDKEERATVDLFVNGRLRERNILKHIPKSRVAESYLYGQIHYDDLDSPDKDRFTSSREGVLSDDPEYQAILTILENNVLKEILNDWDAWRRKHRNDGDPENDSITKVQRKSIELYQAVSSDYIPPKGGAGDKKKIEKWVDALSDDAQFNFGSYAECFISENLIRKYVSDKNINLSEKAIERIEEFKKRESRSKGMGNVSINIRQNNTGLKGDLLYLEMQDLANLVDKVDPQDEDLSKRAGLSRDATEYKPIRDAMAHTALLTSDAKNKLTSVYTNIKGRLKTLLEKA